MATGEQHGFDWKELAINMAAAALIYKAGPEEDKLLHVNADEFSGEMVNNTTQGVVNAGLEDKVEGQQFNMEQIFAQSLGSTVGQKLQSEIVQKMQPATPAYQQAAAKSANNTSNNTNQNVASNYGSKTGYNKNGFFGNGSRQTNKQANSKATSYYGSGNGGVTSKLNNNSVSSSSLDEAGGKNAWVERAHTTLDVTAAAAGTGEFSHAVGDKWKGANDKWYDQKWGGNRFTGGRNVVVETAEKFHLAGVIGFIADTIMDAKEGISAFERSDYFSTIKSGVDIGIGYFGTRNPVGLLIWADYTLNNKYINWVNSMNTQYEQMTGESAWSRIEKSPY